MAQSVTIPLSELKPGLVLPAPIFDASRNKLLLLGQGTKLTVHNLERLRERGISQIAIDSNFAGAVKGGGAGPARPANTSRFSLKSNSAAKAPAKPSSAGEGVFGVAPPIPRPIATQKFSPTVLEKIAQQNDAHRDIVSNVFAEIKLGNRLSGGGLKQVAVESVEVLAEDLDLYVKLAIEPSDNPQEHEHCVRTAKLAMAVASALGTQNKDVEQLGVGCLISRAGVSERARRLMSEQRTLRTDERLELQKAPSATFDALQCITDLSVVARQVAYQVFERFDGSGYPRGRSGVRIHPLARVAAVADVFVALTSVRPYRKPFSPYQAVEQILRDTKARKFDPAVIRGLLKVVCLFPIGSYVELSNGMIAQVMRGNFESYDRPSVLIRDNQGGEKVVDLSKEVDVQISRVRELEEFDDISPWEFNPPLDGSEELDEDDLHGDVVEDVTGDDPFDDDNSVFDHELLGQQLEFDFK